MKLFSIRALGVASITLASVLAGDISASAGDHFHCEMFPHNNLSFPENTGNRVIGQPLFNKIVDRIEEVYTPIFLAQGRTFLVERRWKDPLVNAIAREKDRVSSIHMYGGLARHPMITPDGFLMVACHEVGHHLGGAPFYSPKQWASSEGQSDYFATLKCMKLVLADIDNVAVVSRMAVDPTARRYCASIYKDANEAAICIRSLMGGKALATVLGSLGGAAKPDFMTPDRSQVDNTDVTHPAAQCRLDTYSAGALCSVDNKFDPKDARVGTCDNWGVHARGQRPHCWFNPKDPIERL